MIRFGLAMPFAWAMSFHELGFSAGKSLRLAAGGVTAVGFAGGAELSGPTSCARMPPGAFFRAAHARARALVSASMLGLEPDLILLFFGLRSNAIG